MDKNTGGIGNEAKFLRLRIRNRGRSSIKDCSGFLASIKKTRAGPLLNDEREVLELNWAHRGEAPRSIPRGAFLHGYRRWMSCPVEIL